MQDGGTVPEYEPGAELPWPPEKTQQLRLSLYLGTLRPGRDQDTGIILIDALDRAGLSPTCVLVRDDDQIVPALEKRNIAIHPLPRELCRPRSQIQRSLRTPEFQAQFDGWLSKYLEYEPELGIVFYGWWLPPQLFTAPRYGSINFHPAPLPMMRGFEPETAAVLRGMDRMHGTFHFIKEDFDTGEILWETRPITLGGRETPAEVLELVTLQGINEVPSLFAGAHAGTVKPRPQDNCLADTTDLESVREESVIDWAADDHATIDRRARAFNGQQWKHRLRALVEGRLCCIGRIDLMEGAFPGWPGRRIGTYPTASGADRVYAGQPIIRTTEGAAVVVIEHRCDDELRSCLLQGRCAQAGKYIAPSDVADVRVVEHRVRAGLEQRYIQQQRS